MLAYGKNMPKNNQFSVLCPELIKNCPEKVKNYPKKTCPKLRNFYPEKKISPIHALQAMCVDTKTERKHETVAFGYTTTRT